MRPTPLSVSIPSPIGYALDRCARRTAALDAAILVLVVDTDMVLSAAGQAQASIRDISSHNEGVS